jgi:superfamily II DNA or RNA helicase
MLIYHKISDDKYTPEFIGNDKEFNSYTYAMGQISKQLEDNTWIFSKEGIAQLSNKMGIPSLDTIGDRLKLKPYEYQKEAVSEALSVDGGCLFSLPCGSGRYKF